ncbi:exonuclease mut-7-like protein [Aphelenchoides avenae]|nr:exonuclease mut-7-like protein [Aphelenchus avenae]
MESIEGREKDELMEKAMRDFVYDLLNYAPEALYASFIYLFHFFYDLETPHGEAGGRGAPGTVAILWFNRFDKAVFEEAGKLDRANVLACRSVDKDLVRGALKILMRYTTKKYLVSIDVCSSSDSLTWRTLDEVCVHYFRLCTLSEHYLVVFSRVYVVSYAHVNNETTLVDEFVGEDKARREYCDQYLDMFLGLVVRENRPDVRKRRDQLKAYERDFWETFDPYVVGKGGKTSVLEISAKKRLELYGLPDTVAPNLVNQRCINGLRYHYHAYVEKESDQQQFDETIRQAITCNPVARNFYIRLCWREKQEGLVMRCDYLLGIPRKEWLHQMISWGTFMRKKQTKSRSRCKSMLIERRRQRLEHHAEHKRTELFDDLPILMVDTTDLLVALTAELKGMPENLVLGVGTEYKYSFMHLSDQIALIQISDGQQVWLVDAVTLEEQVVTEQQWTAFFDALFCTDVLKSDYDFRDDLTSLLSTFSYIRPTREKGTKNFVDLYRLIENVSYAHTISGVPLEKTEHTSNWASRPLRIEQKKYAALDAYALVKLYYDICQRMQTAGLVDTADAAELGRWAKINVQVLHKPIKVLPNPPPMKREEAGNLMQVVKRAQEQPVELQQPRPPLRTVKDVKFVVDSMAHGPGCGFFVVLENNRKLVINTCLVDRSYIAISSGKAYREIVRAVGAKQAFDAPTSTQEYGMDRLLAYTIQQLNLVVRPEDIFSHCGSCNGDTFVQVPAPILKALYVIKLVRQEFEHFTADMIPEAVEELQRARPWDYESYVKSKVSVESVV